MLIATTFIFIFIFLFQYGGSRDDVGKKSWQKSSPAKSGAFFLQKILKRMN